MRQSAYYHHQSIDQSTKIDGKKSPIDPTYPPNELGGQS
jgi:hypothetical protein